MPSRRVPGERDDPYAERRARQALVESFAASLPEPASIGAIAASSGLRTSMISLAGSPVRVWTAVLHQAVDEGKVDALLDEALVRDPELVDAIRQYQEASVQ